MISYFQGVLPWLRRRAELLVQELSKYPIPTIDKQLRNQVDTLEDIIDSITEMQQDPTLNLEKYADQNLSRLRNFARQIEIPERRFLPLVEHWNEDVDRAQNLASQICAESHLPATVEPIMSLYSDSYFYVLTDLEIIYIPRLETSFLLHLPDLFHEIGHIVHAYKKLFDDQFIDLIIDYYNNLQHKAQLENSPIAKHNLYRKPVNLWIQRWAEELACDIFAVYLCGPAYAWSHVHLCAIRDESSTIYKSTEDHPANEARLRAMSQTLRNMHFTTENTKISQLWEALVRANSERKPDGFDEEFPAKLLDELNNQVKQKIAAHQIQIYTDKTSSQKFVNLLNEAWERFEVAPSTYVTWEEEALRKHLSYTANK